MTDTTNVTKINPEASQEVQFKAQNVARIKVLKSGISLHDKFEKLKSSKLFVELIQELYIEGEGKNLIALIADPQTNSADQQRSIQMRLGGISALQSFMSQYSQAGLTAKAEVFQLEAINKSLDSGKLVEEVLAELEEAQG